jgi:hypothetical protein
MALTAPKGTVITQTVIDYQSLVDRLKDRQLDQYPVYEFGGGRKLFMNTDQGDGVYDSPTTIVDGKIVHLPNPDLDSTIAPLPASRTIGL